MKNYYSHTINEFSLARSANNDILKLKLKMQAPTDQESLRCADAVCCPPPTAEQLQNAIDCLMYCYKQSLCRHNLPVLKTSMCPNLAPPVALPMNNAHAFTQILPTPLPAVNAQPPIVQSVPVVRQVETRFVAPPRPHYPRLTPFMLGHQQAAQE